MTGRRLYVITATMMLSLFLASIESTVVSTAMPTIVAQLGGLGIYAWVFSAFMLTSTTAVPIFGKLSDIYGRRPIYLLAMTIFLIGSALCGVASSMEQLVLFRAIQGLGAGGLQPLAFTIIGDIFTFEQRAKMQGVFSSVWGVSSVIGPVVGGILVEQVSWHWVFWINVPFGLLTAAMMIVAWRDVNPRAPGAVDYMGAALLAGGITTLMLALFQLSGDAPFDPLSFWSLLLGALTMFAALLWVERRASNPILPLPLFRERLFVTAIGHGVFAGFALFGSTSFIPLFVESVMGTSATQAGATLTPQLLGWVGASIIGSRLLLRFNYRSLALTGMMILVIGSAMMAQISQATPYWMLVIAVTLMGIGMGLSVPSFLIAVQTAVARQALGTATATVQFSRSIGGTLGVSVMGVLLAARLGLGLQAAGLDPNTTSVNVLLNTGATDAAIVNAVRAALAAAVQWVFIAALVAAVIAWIITAFAPRERIGGVTKPAEPLAQTIE